MTKLWPAFYVIVVAARRSRNGLHFAVQLLWLWPLICQAAKRRPVRRISTVGPSMNT